MQLLGVHRLLWHLNVRFPVSVLRLYLLWMSSDTHVDFTGARLPHTITHSLAIHFVL